MATSTASYSDVPPIGVTSESADAAARTIGAHRIQNRRVVVERHHLDEGIVGKMIEERRRPGSRLVQQTTVHAPTTIDQ
jgi:hypothetical protein